MGCCHSSLLREDVVFGEFVSRSLDSLLAVGVSMVIVAHHLSPSFAYSRLGNGLLLERAEDGAHLPPADAPVYLTAEFMPVILVGWLGCALAVGYLRFRDAELA